jgi:hypothetical protein
LGRPGRAACAASALHCSPQPPTTLHQEIP